MSEASKSKEVSPSRSYPREGEASGDSPIKVMKKRSSDATGTLIVVTWNVAGVNSNAFEFSFCTDDRFPDAVSFGRYLNASVKRLTKLPEAAKSKADDAEATKVSSASATTAAAAATTTTNVDDEKRADPTIDTFAKSLNITNAKLLADLLSVAEEIDGTGDVKVGLGIALKGILGGPTGSAHVANSLCQAWHGDSGFSKADMFFKERTWSFTNLRSSNVAQFLKSCDPAKDPKTWWKLWLVDLSNTHAFKSSDIRTLMSKYFIPIAVFDGMLYRAVRHALSTKRWQMDRLIQHVQGFIASMNVDIDKKANGIASALEWVVRTYKPDIISIQENNKFWQKRPGFFKSWKRLGKEYRILDPQQISNPQQVVQLLVRRSSSSGLHFSKKRTRQAIKTARSDAFLAKVRAKLKANCDNFSEQMLDEQIRKLKKIVQTTWVPAVLRTRCGNYVLACGAHGNSKGTDNRAIVAVTDLIAKELNCDVVLGMDANSNNKCKPKDVSHGAASRKVFHEFVEKRIGLGSCFPYDKVEDVGSGGGGGEKKGGEGSAAATKVQHKDSGSRCMVHTVKKERTFLQMQLKKSEKVDQSLKDWVVSTFSFRRSVRVNNFRGPAVWSEDEGEIWLEADCMPNSHCPSDHCMLVTRLRCPGVDVGDNAATPGRCCSIS